MVKPRDIPVTELQRYYRLLSDLLDAANDELSERERVAFRDFALMRVQVVLGRRVA